MVRVSCSVGELANLKMPNIGRLAYQMELEFYHASISLESYLDISTLKTRINNYRLRNVIHNT